MPERDAPVASDPRDFFAGKPLAMEMFRLISQQVDSIGAATIHVSKSQIAFRRRRNFALVWMPDQYLKRQTVPLVLTVLLRHQDRSPRWKQIVAAYPGRFTHHLELRRLADLDEQVRGWLREAWESA